MPRFGHGKGTGRVPKTVRFPLPPGIGGRFYGSLRFRNAPAALVVPVRPGSGAASKGSGLGTGRRDPRLLLHSPLLAILLPALPGGITSMPSQKDLFGEEQQMVTMSFGEHIEELRVRLVLALLGLAVGVILAFIPYLDLGKRVMESMEAPAKVALKNFYEGEYAKMSTKAREAKEISPTMTALIPADTFATAMHEVYPSLEFPAEAELKGKTIPFHSSTSPPRSSK